MLTTVWFSILASNDPFYTGTIAELKSPINVRSRCLCFVFISYCWFRCCFQCKRIFKSNLLFEVYVWVVLHVFCCSLRIHQVMSRLNCFWIISLNLVISVAVVAFADLHYNEVTLSGIFSCNISYWDVNVNIIVFDLVYWIKVWFLWGVYVWLIQVQIHILIMIDWSFEILDFKWQFTASLFRRLNTEISGFIPVLMIYFFGSLKIRLALELLLHLDLTMEKNPVCILPTRSPAPRHHAPNLPWHRPDPSLLHLPNGQSPRCLRVQNHPPLRGVQNLQPPLSRERVHLPHDPLLRRKVRIHRRRILRRIVLRVALRTLFLQMLRTNIRILMLMR